MRIVERRLLRGRNVYLSRPCLLAVIDLQALAEVSSAQLPGFTDRLLGLLPTLMEHRCSPGYVGGFVERLRDGTYMAHIVEHVTIELQCAAGHAVGFGRARQVHGKPGQFRVVVAYRSERVVERALEVAIEIVEALAASPDGALPPLDARLAELRALVARSALGPSTRAIVEAAELRAIPVLRLSDEASLFQLGWGAQQRRIQATTTSATPFIAVNIASDKALTKALLAEAGLPVPRGRTVTTIEEAAAAQRWVGRAVVVKPLDGNQGKGVSTSVTGEAALAAAFERAQKFSRRVIVEQHVEGDDHRVLVIGDAVVAAARRVPPEVTGDGESTVRALVECANADPLRGDGHENMLTKIRLDAAAAEELARQDLHADAVPAAGRPVRLRGNANLSTGGTAQDVTGRVHPDTALACVRAARKIGLDVAGLDVVCTDIAQPLGSQGGAIIEVNAAPGIRMHEHPSHGERHHVGRAIVASLFPFGSDGRIPVIAVTGSNGKTTTVLAIDHVLRSTGRTTGVTTTEGVFIDGRQVVTGDCTGYWSARTVLTAPEVEIAVLETARGGLLKRGLAFDRCDVAVVLNVQGDHLGQDGVETLDDLAQVKGVIVGAARRAVVLNADDARCVALATKTRRGVETIYFTHDARQPVFAAHVESGGRGVYEEQGRLMWADGGHHQRLVSAEQLPFTLAGKARHNVANAMAACAALLALSTPAERVVAGLAGFTSSESQNPLRLNFHRTQGVTVLVDYAHNATAYQALADTARQLAEGRLIGVVAAPGDRREADLFEIGRVCGAGFDAVVVYEMDDLRRRPAGVTARVIRDGALQGRRERVVTTGAAAAAAAEQEGRTEAVSTVLDVRQAIRSAVEHAQPGDLVVVGCASHLSDLRTVLGTLAAGAAPAGADAAAAIAAPGNLPHRRADRTAV